MKRKADMCDDRICVATPKKTPKLNLESLKLTPKTNTQKIGMGGLKGIKKSISRAQCKITKFFQRDGAIGVCSDNMEKRNINEANGYLGEESSSSEEERRFLGGIPPNKASTPAQGGSPRNKERKWVKRALRQKARRERETKNGFRNCKNKKPQIKPQKNMRGLVD